MKDNPVHDVLHLVALVPHISVRTVVMKRRNALFEQGFYGAYSFPVVAPLALLCRPLSFYELKSSAVALRLWTLAGGHSGKIVSKSKTAAVMIYPPFSMVGAELNIPALPMPLDAVLKFFEKVTLCFTLTDTISVPDCSIPDFSACAIANVAIRPLEKELSFEWKIGMPAWLPNPATMARERM